MGKHKAQKKVSTKRKQVVAKTFKCLFCATENSVDAKLDHKTGIGTLKCRVCNDGRYSGRIHALTEPIDLFSEWLDEVHQLNEEQQHT